jgi:hypothetical protein
MQEPATDEDEAWIKKAHEARMSQLETVRSSAKDWASTITAVTGAISIVALIKGPRGHRTTDQILGGSRRYRPARRGHARAQRHILGGCCRPGYAPLICLLARGLSPPLRSAARTGGARPSRIKNIGCPRNTRPDRGDRYDLVWGGEGKRGSPRLRGFKDGTVACGVVSAGKGGVLLIKEPDNAEPAKFEPATGLTLVPVGKCPP